MAFIAGSPMLWKVGFAVAWLVGSWLFGPKQKKNEILDPGAEEMPRWNTALRGIIIPVLFGTNRVSSQIVWQHDYTVVRTETQEGGGGGKMGGSGGGKGGAQTGSINYEYFWDLVYHIGMVPEKFALIKGWMGAQRINNEAMAAIIGGSSGELVFTDVNDPNAKEDDKVTMSFQDSVFYSGSGAALSGDADYDGWSELLADEGVAIRWPHTVYVGFKQLSLGDYPSIPQMSWEVGPGTASIIYNNSYKAKYVNSTKQFKSVEGATPFFIGDDGVTYAIYSDSHHGNAMSAVLYSVDTATNALTFVKDYTNAELLAIVNTYSAVFVSGSRGSIGVLDPTNYLAFAFSYYDGITTFKNCCAVLKINSASALECVGYAQYDLPVGDRRIFHNLNIAIANNRTSSDPIMTVYMDATIITSSVLDAQLCLALFPALDDLIGQDLDYNSTIGGYNAKLIGTNVDNQLGGYDDHAGNHPSYRPFWTYYWSVPYVDGLSLCTRIYFYIGKGDMQKAIDTGGTTINQYVLGLSATYPNGCVGYFDMGLLSFGTVLTSIVAPTPVIDNNSMVLLGTSTSVLPFSDAGLYADASTVDTKAYGDYDPHPFTHKITSGPNTGIFIVIFSQFLPEDSTISLDYMSGTTYSSYMRGRVFAWNATDKIHSQVKTVAFQPFDRATNLGGGATDDIVAQYSMLAFFDSTQELFYSVGVWDITFYKYLVIGTVGDLTIGGGDDVTPPYVIYQILTSDIFGIGLETTQIDSASYLAAVDYCTTNNFLISVQYRREESVLSIIDDLLSCYGGFLVISNGVVKFKQLEYLDGAATSVRTLDNDHFIVDDNNPPVQISKGARQDTFNKIRVNYFDRDLEYAQNQVEEADEVDQDLNGIRPREFPALFVMQEDMARTMATRALWANLYSRDTYEFKLGWKDSDLEPGDVITLVDSFHTSLQGGVIARIIEWKERARGEFDVVAKQEFEYILSNSAEALNITSASIINKIGAIPTIKDFTMYELPAEYQSGAGMAYVSWAANEFAAGAHLWLSTDGVSFAKVQNMEPYQINGILMDGLPNDDAMVENVQVLLAPRSDWISTASYYYDQTLSDAGQASRAVGATLMWCGSEMMAYQGLTLVAANRYRFDKLYRGWGGTNVHAHNSGDVWYKQGGGVFYQDVNEDRIGTIVMYKVQPYNLGHASVNISSINAKSYTIVGQHYLPQNPSKPQYNDGGGKLKEYVASTIDIPINWHATARKRGFGSRGYGSYTYGDFTADSVSYRVQVVGSGGATVRSEAVSVTSFNYTSSKNFADNGAWRGNVAFKITPYNSAGLATLTEVISLDLWT